MRPLWCQILSSGRSEKARWFGSQEAQAISVHLSWLRQDVRKSGWSEIPRKHTAYQKCWTIYVYRRRMRHDIPLNGQHDKTCQKCPRGWTSVSLYLGRMWQEVPEFNRPKKAHRCGPPRYQALQMYIRRVFFCLCQRRRSHETHSYGSWQNKRLRLYMGWVYQMLHREG